MFKKLPTLYTNAVIVTLQCIHLVESKSRSIDITIQKCKDNFLPRDASAERGYEIAFVCLSVRNVQVPCSNTLEFFGNNFTAE